MLSENTKAVKFCPKANTSVEFMCVAQNLTTLVWRKNGTESDEIQEIHLRYKPFYSNSAYTVFVDNNTRRDEENRRFGVIISRLKIANRSDIHNGDKIECIAYINAEPTTADYLTINHNGKL